MTDERLMTNLTKQAAAAIELAWVERVKEDRPDTLSDRAARAAWAVFEEHAKELATSPEHVKNPADSSQVEAAHAPTDDEREALAMQDAVDYPEEYEHAAIRVRRAFLRGLDARRTVQGEPTAPWDSSRGCFGHCDKEGWYSECVSKVADPEPQGEPSDAEIEAARYRERLGDLEGADDEALAHTPTSTERAQGEPSDAAVAEAVHAIGLRGFHVTAAAMRAALRAAGEVGR